MNRKIPDLQVLCLRSIGGHGCNAEDTFAPVGAAGSDPKQQQQSQKQNNSTPKQLSAASRLLRSFTFQKRSPVIGKGGARRKQANDVDLNHPWVANSQGIMEFGSPSLDVLQQFIDALVELGRMDDGRLGLHFFQEWRANVLLMDNTNNTATDNTNNKEPPTKRRRNNNNNNKKSSSTDQATPPPLGSLSLHNAILHQETIEAMVESQMLQHLAVLDLTGIQTLTDDLLERIVSRAPHLQRLSVKNCRRLTHEACDILQACSKLTALDIGGSYNLQPTTRIIELVCHLMHLTELHASGLPWTAETIRELTSLRDSWKALSLGFLVQLPHSDAPATAQQAYSPPLLKDCLQLNMLSQSLQSLALPFCEHQLVDAALMGVLGRHLPNLRALDVRGNGNLASLTGWYDGRATIVPPVGPQPLFVLARYSGISKSSLEDTKRIHPLATLELTCVLDSEGIGMGIILRNNDNEEDENAEEQQDSEEVA